MMNNQLQVAGFARPEYKNLKQAFYDIFAFHRESGAAISVFKDGQLVVNLYGSLNSHNGEWEEQDRVCTMSCSKAPLALCILILVDRGLLDLDTPIVHYWPDFGSSNKSRITTRMILNHTSGLVNTNKVKPGDIFNWSKMIKGLEDASPTFTPGKVLAYHALSFGHLLGELIHRIDGRMPRDFFHQEVAQPFDIDYDLSYFDKHKIRQIKETSQFKASTLKLMSYWLPFIPFWKFQYFRPCNEDYHPNSEQWKNSEIPAVTGQGSAKGLAKFYAILANKGILNDRRLLSEELVNQLSQTSCQQKERSSNTNWRMGLGFILNSPELCSFGPNSESFGHFGMGGAVGFADPDANLSFSYVTEHYHQPNKQDRSIVGKRTQLLIDALYMKT